MSLSGNCEEHDWSWDPSDDYGCPVCYGINIERDRIIALLEAESRCKGNEHDYNGDCYCDTIAFIKGENNAE